MKIIALFLLIITFAFGSLTDDAYKAYRAKNYKKAFMLYNKAYNQGSIKAAYNLAVFYQQGIGVKKDTQKAIKYYQVVEDHIEKNIYSDYICLSKMINYFKKALKNLNSLSPSYNTKKLIEKLDAKCPNINSISKNDIKKFRYYKVLAKKYPKTVKEIIYYKKKLNSLEVYSLKRDYYKKKLIKISKPIMKFYLQKNISCIKKAKTYGDLEDCRFERAYMFDSIFGEGRSMDIVQGYADAIHLYSTKEEQEQYRKIMKSKILQKDKKEIIKKIKNLIKNCNFRCVDFVYEM